MGLSAFSLLLLNLMFEPFEVKANFNVDYKTGGYRSNGSFESQQLQALYILGKDSTKYAPLHYQNLNKLSHTVLLTWTLGIWLWTEGRFGKVNWAGINFYNRLIDALLQKGNFQFSSWEIVRCFPNKKKVLHIYS